MPSQHTDYTQVRGVDNFSPSEGHCRHDDDSSTDVGDSVMGDSHRHRDKIWDEEEEAADRMNLHRRTKGRSSWLRSRCSATMLQGLVNTFLLFVVLALLIDRRRRSVDAFFEGAGDMTGVIPPAAQRIQSFVPDPGFAPENGSEFFTDAVQKKWLGIVPTGLGYIEVHDPSKHNNLPHPLEGYDNKTVFTTSVTHQLHCLYNIIEVFSSLTSGQEIAPQMKGHLPHCFEYLRQSIMCCGDTALEGQHTTFPDGTIGSDGWDALHVCKDYEAIAGWLEEHRADDQVWI